MKIENNVLLTFIGAYNFYTIQQCIKCETTEAFSCDQKLWF